MSYTANLRCFKRRRQQTRSRFLDKLTSAVSAPLILPALVLSAPFLSRVVSHLPLLLLCLAVYLLPNGVGWMLSCRRNPITIANIDISWPLAMEGQLWFPPGISPTTTPPNPWVFVGRGKIHKCIKVLFTYHA